jgi:ferritin-like protein
MSSSEGLHEPAGALRSETIEMHRAIASLIEELEAVDWYAQRVDATGDEALRAVLVHNRDEEKEHAAMTLEWIRRQDPVFDQLLRRILFRAGPIAAEPAAEPAQEPARRGDGHAATLGLGSLREEPGA